MDLSENNDPQKGFICTMNIILEYIIDKYKEVMIYLREILFLTKGICIFRSIPTITVQRSSDNNKNI